MSKRQLLCIIAVWVAVFPSPFFGLPTSWKTLIGVATGIVIFIIAYFARAQDFTSSASDAESNKSFEDSAQNTNNE